MPAAEIQTMTDILRNPEPSDVVKAIEANTIESLLTWTKWAKIELHQDADLVWMTSDIPYFLYNLAFPTKSALVAPESFIETAIASAGLRDTPIGCWVGPFSPQSEFGDHLVARGFIHGATMTAMAVDLSTLNEHAPMPQGFVISEVKSMDDLVTWCQIMTTVSEFPDFAAAAFLEMYRDIGICGDPDWRLYLGAVDGAPVGTSSLFFNAGVAGIHSVATVPEFRGLGIGTALTRSPLLDVRRQGYEIGVLYSSEMAVGLYRDIGFQEYGQGHVYLWQPDEREPALQS